MKISDKEIKDVLANNTESPSYGFSTKTMRLIEESNMPNEVYAPIGISKWILGLVFLIFLGCLFYSFTIDPIAIKYFNYSIPFFSVFWMWSLAVFFMAIGLWVWILVYLKTKPKL